MNYLREVLVFNDYAEMNGLDPQEFRLWHVLMACNNRFHWADSFTMPMILLQAKSGLSEKAVYRARAKLVKRGLITVKNRGGSQAAAYQLNSLYTPYAADTAPCKEDEYEAEDETKEEADRQSDRVAVNLSDNESDNQSESRSDNRSVSESGNVSGSLSGSVGDKAGGKLSVLYKHKDKIQTKQNKKHIGAGAPKRARAIFKPPTIDEVEAYCKERGSSVKPSQWLSYYEANGWRVGKNPMKDWQASVRTWENNGVGAGKAAAPAASVYEEKEGMYL